MADGNKTPVPSADELERQAIEDCAIFGHPTLGPRVCPRCGAMLQLDQPALLGHFALLGRR